MSVLSNYTNTQSGANNLPDFNVLPNDTLTKGYYLFDNSVIINTITMANGQYIRIVDNMGVASETRKISIINSNYTFAITNEPNAVVGNLIIDTPGFDITIVKISDDNYWIHPSVVINDTKNIHDKNFVFSKSYVYNTYPIVDIEINPISVISVGLNESHNIPITGNFLKSLTSITMTSNISNSSSTITYDTTTFTNTSGNITLAVGNIAEVFTLVFKGINEFEHTHTLEAKVPSGNGVAGTKNYSFESSFEDWIQKGTNNWLMDQSGTPSSNTGPSNAVSGNFYIYTEVSGISSANTFILENDNFAQATTIVFSYHMNGADTGTLKLQYYNGANWLDAWSKSGNQGNNWSQETIDLTNLFVTKLRFHATGQKGFRGDIALDNITITSI